MVMDLFPKTDQLPDLLVGQFALGSQALRNGNFFILLFYLSDRPGLSLSKEAVQTNRVDSFPGSFWCVNPECQFW